MEQPMAKVEISVYDKPNDGSWWAFNLLNNVSENLHSKPELKYKHTPPVREIREIWQKRLA